MRQHTVSSDYFQWLKTRWESIAAECDAKGEIEGIDPLLVPILLELNRHPDIVTVWSCQGHPEAEKPTRSGHVLMATTTRPASQVPVNADLVFNPAVIFDTNKVPVRGVALSIESVGLEHEAVLVEGPYTTRYLDEDETYSMIWEFIDPETLEFNFQPHGRGA